MKCLVEILSAINENNIGRISNKEFDVNYRIADNETIFSYAISIPDFTHLDYFLKKNPNFEVVNDYGENILHSAVYSGSLDKLKEIFFKIPKSKELINIQSKDGSTPLLLAILLGYYDLAIFLIDKNADVNLSDNEGNTPLHIACYHGCLVLVKKLIEHQANPFKKTNKGNYPLSCAVNEDKKDVVIFLVQSFYF